MGKELNYLLIGVVLVVVILAIAAGVFLFGSSEDDNECSTCNKNIAFSASSGMEKMSLTLSKGGNDMPAGGWPEENWSIYVDNTELDNTGYGSWDKGEEINLIQDVNREIKIDFGAIDYPFEGTYDIEIRINDVVVYSGTLKITPETSEFASVSVRSTDSQIKILLAAGGSNAPYLDVTGSIGFDIYLNGTKVDRTWPSVGETWEVGESIILTGDISVGGQTQAIVAGSEYDLTVVIMETVVCDTTIKVID